MSRDRPTPGNEPDPRHSAEQRDKATVERMRRMRRPLSKAEQRLPFDPTDRMDVAAIFAWARENGLGHLVNDDSTWIPAELMEAYFDPFN